jgi:hypothetical protein
VGGTFALISGCNHPTGSTSFGFIDREQPAPAVDAEKLDITKSVDVFVQAKPELPLAAPIYPKIALSAKMGTVSILDTIEIDKDGHVTNVRPSTTEIRIPTRYDDEFDQAIRVAVAQWEFEPAKAARLAPSNDGPTVMNANDVETSLDVRFVFSTNGIVSSDIRK